MDKFESLIGVYFCKKDEEELVNIDEDNKVDNSKENIIKSKNYFKQININSEQINKKLEVKNNEFLKQHTKDINLETDAIVNNKYDQKK